MAVTQKVTLYNNKFTVPPVINAVQNDTDRQVEAYFGDFTLQVGMTGKLSFIRSDRTHYEVSATLSTANNTATAELDQALTQAGVTQAQLKITDSGNVGSTFTFMIKVQPDVAGISQQQDGYSAEELAQAISDNTAAITNINNVELPKKADQDGYYEDLTSGTSLAVLGTPVVESVPYLFRRSASIGVRESDKVIGGTVAWNQLVQNGNFASTTGWSDNRGTLSVSNNVLTITITTTSGAANINRTDLAQVAGHKYLYAVSMYAPKQVVARVQYSTIADGVKTSTVSANTWTRIENIVSAISTDGIRIYYNTSQTLSVGDEVSIKDCIGCDLTQMLGTSLADYVYTLESGTDGAGIAWLRANGFGYMLDNYHAYDSGSLQSVKTSAHKTVGKNLLDMDNCVDGLYINANSGIFSSIEGASVFYAQVAPNSTYVVSCERGDRTLIASYSGGTPTALSNYKRLIVNSATLDCPKTFTTNSDESWIAIYLNRYANTKPTQVMLEVGSTATAYEPYESHTYPLDSDLELRGIPKLDGSNKLYYDGDSYEHDGKVVRKYGTRAYQSGDESLVDAITDGTTTVYKLTTPTTETADAYQDPQICSPFGTEEYIDTRDVPVPVGHETEYYSDPVAEIERVSVQVPVPPTANGTYRLTCVVSGGVPTYSWTS